MTNNIDLSLSDLPFESFIQNIKDSLHSIFHEINDIDLLSQSRGLPAKVWKEIMSLHPLSVAVPKQHGGRGISAKECMGLLATASYESLALSLLFGINVGLFLESFGKYAEESVKTKVYKNFMTNSATGGLMITEPKHGSDALNMTTYNEKIGDDYKIKGTKHWQGLTGMADYWILASRKKNANGTLSRDIDFFLTDESIASQEIKVVELYDNAGLYMIPYGLNKVDISLPASQKLVGESSGITMMRDILHRSRLQFPGMAMGFIKRMMDEAIAQCENRIVGHSNLLSLDQVQFQLAKIQSSFTICSAMCAKSVKISGIEHNLAAEGLHANSMKALITDLMQDAAQNYTQLSGAQGYRTSHIGGRGIMDSRPFQIFEGSNEMLYTQVAEMTVKESHKMKNYNLAAILENKKEAKSAAKVYHKELDFSIANISSQRKLVDLGKIVARVISVNDVLHLSNNGFNPKLIDNCIALVRQEISVLVHSMSEHADINVIRYSDEKSNWMDFV